jgi:hypothetical protein
MDLNFHCFAFMKQNRGRGQFVSSGNPKTE